MEFKKLRLFRQSLNRRFIRKRVINEAYEDIKVSRASARIVIRSVLDWRKCFYFETTSQTVDTFPRCCYFSWAGSPRWEKEKKGSGFSVTRSENGGTTGYLGLVNTRAARSIIIGHWINIGRMIFWKYRITCRSAGSDKCSDFSASAFRPVFHGTAAGPRFLASRVV